MAKMTPNHHDDTWISPDADEIDAMTRREVAALVIAAAFLLGAIAWGACAALGAL